MQLLGAKINQPRLRRLLLCPAVGGTCTLAIVTTLFIMNFMHFVPWIFKQSRNNVNIVEKREHYYFENSDVNATTDIITSTPHVPIDEFWAFEPTRRLYDDRTDLPTKVVLLWTLYFGDWSDHFGHNHGSYVELDMYNSSKRCHFTRNRTYLENASALLFHGRDLIFEDLPEKRFPWQRWVFYFHESPLHSEFNDSDWNKVNALHFNWTMTYSKLGNVYWPYGHIRHSKKSLDLEAINKKIYRFAKSFKTRPKDAIWVVSNCRASSKRQKYVDKLESLGIKVDIFGNCGDAIPPDYEWIKYGEKQFFSRYRFVLALENSLCEDYVTEKAFHGFYVNFIAGPITIVYNGGNNSDFFPSGSYIDMRSFNNISDLVSSMKRLSNSDENSPELLRYYDWQKELNPVYDAGYELETFSDVYAYYYTKRPGWRTLCKALWDNDTGTNEMPRKNYKSSYVNDIRRQLGHCFDPDLTPLD